MSKIQLLSKNLQNQIAAGEVVERPASIIKEIVENSLDAGSKKINIEINEGGIKKIKIIDDGEGMNEEDAKMAFTRYATSKISCVDDLFTLDSFGFRGEAIASIASVSHMTLRTKTGKNKVGIEVINSGDIAPIGMQTGTEILVENLFWNVPARKKFLKTPQTESREIIKIIEAFALANPQVSFRFKKDEKEIFHFYGSTEKNALKNRIEQVLGKDISQNLLEIQHFGQTEKISGFITHPNFHRSSRDRQFFFVNKRIIQGDSTLGASLAQSYQTLMPKGKFPAGVIFLNIPPDLVDVNVHPRKTQVKFTNASHIFQILKNSFVATLSSSNSEKISPNVRAYDYTPLQKVSSWSSPSNSSSRNFMDRLPGEENIRDLSPLFPSQNFSTPQEIFQNIPSGVDSRLRGNDEKKVIGQVRKSFIIVEEKNRIRVVDQHAAHERVRYEELLRNFRAKKPQSQPLLTPQIFSVSYSEKEKILEQKTEIENLGFVIEDFGGQEISVSSVPTGNTKIDIEKLFRNLLDDLDSFDPSFGEHTHSFTEKLLSYSACRGAIKFGDILTLPEMEKLIDDLDDCSHPQACAHGRPVSTFFGYDGIENDCGRY